MSDSLDASRAALHIDEIHKTYVVGISGCRAVVRALQGATLVVAPGETIVLLGPRGAGKTALLLCAAGLSLPDRGRVLAFGAPIRMLGEGAARYIDQRDGRSAVQAQCAAASGTTRLLLLDGVLDAMDRCARRDLFAAFAERADEGAVAVIATDDASFARRLHLRVVEIAAGRLRGDEESSPRSRVAEGVVDRHVDSGFRRL